jgi:putative spermidine/putrescine transport system permease protein
MSLLKDYLKKEQFYKLLPLFPSIVFLLVFFCIPVMMLLSTSFFSKDFQFSFSNYVRLFSTPVYAQVLIITFKISIYTTFITLFAAYPAAYFLATISAQKRKWIILLVLMPFWTSFLVRTFAWIILLGRNGAVNNFLISIGIIDAPISLIYNLTGVLIGMVHGMIPLAILTMLPVMQNIDKRLMPAATTLGASHLRAFWQIFFPMSMPGVAAAGLLVFITCIGFFIVPALLGGAKQTMISQLIITSIQELLNWNFAGAISLMLLIITGIIFFIYDKALGLSTLTGSNNDSSQQLMNKQNYIKQSSMFIANIILRVIDYILFQLDKIDFVLASKEENKSPAQKRFSGKSVPVFAIFVIMFLSLPTIFVIPVSLTTENFVRFPPELFSFKWYMLYFDSNVWISATVRSLIVAFFTAIFATILGTSAAFALVRVKFDFKTQVLAFLLAPLILPRIVIAVSIYYLFAHLGLVGTNIGLIIGHTVLAIPYVVITVMAVLQVYDERYDQAAYTLGANKYKTLKMITLPQIQSGILAGFLFAFVTSFDDLTVALFISGGSNATLPRQMWNDLLLQVNPTLAAVSTVMLIFVTIVILVAEKLKSITEQR